MNKGLENTYMVGGEGLKSISLWGDEGWNDLATGQPVGDKKPSVNTYYRRIPWLYRGVNLKADAAASMPFDILPLSDGSPDSDAGVKPVDSSSDYKNAVEFLPDPVKLFWLVEASLTLFGRAYLWRARTALGTKELRYVLPTSIKPVIDEKSGQLTGFERYTGREWVKVKLEDVIYFWLPDTTIEVGPPNHSPATAAMSAAGVLFNIDQFAASFFDHGAIKVTLLSVKGNTTEQERNKLQEIWNNILSGIKGAWKSQVINGDAVTPTVIGEGLESLQKNDLTSEKRADISTALGIPQTKLFSEGAGGLGGGGVVSEDDIRFYRETVEPDCRLIQQVFNTQVFEPLGYRLAFKPESLGVYQEDETKRAQALGQLTSAGLPLMLAMDILKYKLTAQQKADIEKAEAEKEARAEEAAQAFQQGRGKPGEKPQPGKPSVDEQAQADKKRWKTKALKAIERGKAASVPFESEHISAAEHERITAKLAEATTAAQVEAVFDAPEAGEVDPLKMLAEELKRANDLLEKEG